MQRKIDFSIGEYYHIYSRGTEKRKIFLESKDYKRFKVLLYICNNEDSINIGKHLQGGGLLSGLYKIKKESSLVDIGIYSLMPNHFHIVIKEKTEGGISKFLGKLLTGYSMYFNKKNNRSGALFESRFKAKHIDNDEYLKYLFAYIHLNPIKLIDSKWKENGISDRKYAQKHLEEYSFSSYQDYKNIERLQSKIINKEVFPEYFSEEKDFDLFIDEWLSFPKVLEE
ncbi:MAG: transposase [Burkholderiales bacterium]|nr:transposase [Burkholderiales bacterium]